MRKTHLIAIALLSLPALAFSCNRPDNPPPPPPPGPNYIVFLDLTLSLNEAQQQSMNGALKQLCASIPARSQVNVYPLGGYVAKTGVRLVHWNFPDDRFVATRSDLQRLRVTLPATLRKAATEFQATVTDRQFAQHTCISDAIRRAQDAIADDRGAERTEIIIISDMLEDCPSSLLGGSISLEKTDIRAELSRVQALPASETLADLQGAKVTCIVPGSAATATKTRQPEIKDLRAFWSGVFSHCNGKDFYLDTYVPSRLGTPPA